MPTPLENAITTLQEEWDSYHPGVVGKQPEEGSTDWYKLRVCTLGLAYLKRIQVLGIEQKPKECEALYKLGNLLYKKAALPPEALAGTEEKPVPALLIAQPPKMIEAEGASD